MIIRYMKSTRKFLLAVLIKSASNMRAKEENQQFVTELLDI